jgi:hypothetical protein
MILFDNTRETPHKRPTTNVKITRDKKSIPMAKGRDLITRYLYRVCPNDARITEAVLSMLWSLPCRNPLKSNSSVTPITGATNAMVVMVCGRRLKSEILRYHSANSIPRPNPIGEYSHIFFENVDRPIYVSREWNPVTVKEITSAAAPRAAKAIPRWVEVPWMNRAKMQILVSTRDVSIR